MATEIEISIKTAIETANSAKSLSDLRKSLKDLNSLALQTQGVNSTAFNKVAEAIGNTQDRVEDLRDEFVAFRGSALEKFNATLNLTKEGFTNLDLDKVKTGFKALNTIVAANPFLVLIPVIQTLIENFDVITEYAMKFAEALEDYPELLNAIGGASLQLAGDIQKYEEALRAVEEAQKDGAAAAQRRFDAEIEYARAAGKETIDLEIAKQKAIIETNRQAILQLEFRRQVAGELTEEERNQLKELIIATEGAYKAINVAILTEDKKKADARKKSQQDELSDFEKLVAKERELDTAITEAITDGDVGLAHQLSIEYNNVAFEIEKIKLQAEQAKNGIEKMIPKGLDMSAFKVELPKLEPIAVPVDNKTEVLPDGTRVTLDEYNEYLDKAEESANTALNRAQMISDALLSITTSRLQAQTEAQLASIDKEKEQLDTKYAYEEEKLQNKALGEKLTESQQQTLRAEINAKKIKEQEELDKKEADIRRKAFNREKALNIAKIITNAAVEAAKISGIIASFISGVATAPLSAAGISQLVTLGISTAAQVAVVAAQKPPAFASGGLVSGPGTGTSDSILANVSNGESVINANSTALFGPLLSAINQAGGGKSFNSGSPMVASSGASTSTTESTQIIKAYVTETDITTSQNKARRVERFSSF